MNALKLVAIALIAAGVLGLAYGSFSYTKETVNIPVWAGVLAIAVGAGMLVMGNRRA